MQEKVTVHVDRDLADLVPLFLKTRDDDMANLAVGLATNDFTAMRAIGHAMKGSGGSFGFDPVTAMGDIIEKAALAGDAATIATQLAELRSYLARVEISFQ
jgi:HPt (histidine-containing phosphotransfer) domain-containing protein